ncbi:SDR family NAD(P)-dependent oxidoreductase [Marinobacter halophilus]|uniref:Short-chain dehydrogenase n=1 Tax=Marinobacter halophilus TaxID=1323740 RepID=A0A2T1KEJ7_9GAMM|nr:SDR family NAD(P)-dependent oxidoreductase [Marinobacter halophilus]PSF08535.1 short-chain dehydrogenase [Marinobacter halophilus]GGC61458.1 putative short chain dehydrogenase/reductase [Marinobacter halophilus]
MFANTLSKNARAVITGAGSGIGKAMALELGRRQSLVVCSDINLDAAEQTASEIRRSGGQAWAVACDVSDLAQVQALADKADELLPEPVNLVINNAGVGVGGKAIGETSMQDWEWTVNINFWGVVYGCHVFAPRLRQQKQAGIINVASTASFSAAPLMGPYNATKAAALAISETLAAELSGTGVTVTALCPTLVKTNISANGRIQGESNELFNRLMDRFGMSAERVARMALDGLDRGQLYVMPQVDARMIWRLKRLLPNTYAAVTGLINRRITSNLT